MGKKRKRMLARLRQERASIVQASSTPSPLVIEPEPVLAVVSVPKKKASKRKYSKSRTKKA